MCFDPIVLFFVLGIGAILCWPSVQLPKWIYTTISVYLLVSIGLKGGLELCSWASWHLVAQAVAIIILSVISCFVTLYFLNRWPYHTRQENIVIAAHYGSVSVGTFAVALSILDHAGIAYESYMPLFVALMESPAIIVAALLLSRTEQNKQSLLSGMWHAINCKSIYILFASLFIGYAVGQQMLTIIEPIFITPFKPILAIFLFEMGVLVGKQYGLIKQRAAVIIMHSIFLSLIGGLLGLLMGVVIQLSLGGVILLMVLGASASYIAVPAALRQSFPSANVPLALSHSLGATFPFNVFIGVYLYMYVARFVFDLLHLNITVPVCV